VKPSLALAAVLLALAAGCGGGGDGRLSKSEYEARMSALGNSVRLVVGASDFKDVPAEFHTLARQLGEVAARLKAIRPPKDVADVHARIVDGFAKEAAMVKQFAARLHGASPAQVKTLLRQFDSAALAADRQEIADAGKALAARGYKISSSGGT
jgi:hypothetical protein